MTVSPLGFQIPTKKVLWGVFRGLNTFLEGIWSPRGLTKIGLKKTTKYDNYVNFIVWICL